VHEDYCQTPSSIMDIKKEKTPNAGSDEAVDLGCTCPIMDNEYGKGYMGMEDVFVFNTQCPLHGEALKEVFEDN
jgi:hypothetical protein